MDIAYFIYPFVKYYQSALHLEKIDTGSLEDLVNHLIKVYQEQLSDDYDLKLEEAHQAYLPALESGNLMNKEKMKYLLRYF